MANHKNFAQTTLAAAITDTTGTSITVTSETSFPSVPFIISIDTEAMLVTTVNTTTWTVTRGYEGSTAATHTNGTAIYHDWSAGEADSTVHGPSSATDGHLTVYDGATGKIVKDGGAVTAAGLALLDDADAAAQRTTLGAAPLIQPINAQTETTYTFVIGDAGKLVTFGSASATTVTIPTNASVAFSVGTHIDCLQVAAGKVTFAGASGVTINSKASNKAIGAQWVGVTLIKTATDTWSLLGDLVA